MDASAESLLRLLNDILDFSKVESGKLQLESVDFYPEEHLQEAFQLLAAVPQNKRIDLCWEVADDTPPLVRGDPTRVRQVLINLVGNAISFTQQGEVSVSLRPASHDSAGITLQFDVVDTGIGIPPEQCNRIFEVFAQGDMSTTRKFGGTGLGLAISERLVHLMGGTISVKSQPSRGSHFTFTIRVQPAGSTQTKSLPSFPGRTAFVVAEKEKDAALLLRFLRGWELTCTLARSPEEAVQKAQIRSVTNYDVVLLAPAVDGFDPEFLSARIQEIFRCLIPTISIDAACHLQTKASATSAGFIRLIKPLRREPLHSAIQQLLAKRPVIPASRESAPVGNSASLRVLLAEDNCVNQRLISKLLEKMGHHVSIAQNGQEALETMQHQQFELVVMDMQMPVMDGVEATRRIRTLEQGSGRHVPILALTANAFDEDRSLCIQAGMDVFLAKPVSPATLRAEVERLTSVSTATPESMSTK